LYKQEEKKEDISSYHQLNKTEEVMQSNRAIIVADLGFGDAGKGSIIDFLARKGRVSTVVRYNGGCQAAHNVVTPDGRHHTFRQFGSGTFVSGVRTHLSRFMLVNPLEIATEAQHLMEVHCRNPYERLSVDENAVIITPFHQDVNRIRERARGDGAHGSCGMGVGETVAMSLARPDTIVRAKDLKDKDLIKKKLGLIREFIKEEFADTAHDETLFLVSGIANVAWSSSQLLDRWADVLFEAARHINVVSGDYLHQFAKEGNLLFEGAQGVLLDEWYGFHPHTTWSTTTFGNAQTLLNEIDYGGEVERLGVLRAYYTRHGTGPFVTEDSSLTRLLPDSHNGDRGWQGVFRSGWFDFVMARYALSVTGGVDSLVITNLDRFIPISERKVCGAYRFNEADVSLEEKTALANVIRDETGSSVFVGDIKKKQVLTDLSYQERLTGLLKKATPSYETVVGGIDEYVAFIEASLSTPVSMTSHGPTAIDKRSRIGA
jgi:adenylosuccinate synthase